MSLLKIRPFSIDLTDTFTFANANITGNIISGNANLGNLATSNYFVGNGSLLSSINGSNITGQVGNALVAGTVYGAAQANITSLGTLTGLTSGGTVNFTSSSNVTLGPVGNLHITGGTAGYFLQTDGSGGLTWASAASGTGNANIAGSNTQIFFNDNGSATLGAKSTFTFDKVTDTLAVTNLTANGAGITYITGANVTGNVASAVQSHFANIANSVAGANVTGAVALATYATTANSVAGANVSGTVAQATYAGTANSVAGANVSGTVAQATYAGTANSVAGANVSGTVAQATYAGTANSVAGANVSGEVGYAAVANSVAGANVSGAVGLATYATTANAVAGANVSGTVAQATYATTANAVAGANVSGNVTSAVQSHFANIANSVAGANVSGNVTSAVQSHFANIANSVSWSNVTSTPTTISGYGITDAYGNSNAGAYLASYTGELAGANLVLTGNLVISGTTTSVNSTITRVVDPIFELGGGANGAVLTNDDGKDRGTVLHYYTGGATRDAFMGWDSSNVEFGFGSNVTITNEVAAFNTYGNLRAGYFLGNGSQLTGVSASSSLNIVNGTSNVDIATTGGNVTVGVGGTAGVVTITTTGVNISGTLNSTGNLTASNANLGNLATANFFTGNGSLLTSITGANISGNVTSAVQSHYANIANSVAGANVSGEVTYAATANAVAGANVSGQVGNALVAGTVYTAAQPNITSTGTLTSLTVSGNVAFSGANVTLGSVANLHIGGGSANYYLQTDGSGALSWTAVPTTSMNVDTFTGDGSWTMKTLTATPTSINYTLVAIGGVFQPRDAYSIAGAVITFDDPPPNGAIVEVTTIVAGAGGGGGGGGVSWTYSAVSANTSAVAGYRYIVDTATANLTITLPASGTLGDEIMIIDGTGNASAHAMTIDRNGGKIQGAASNMTVTTDRAAFTLVYYNSTQGWLLTNV